MAHVRPNVALTFLLCSDRSPAKCSIFTASAFSMSLFLAERTTPVNVKTMDI